LKVNPVRLIQPDRPELGSSGTLSSVHINHPELVMSDVDIVGFVGRQPARHSALTPIHLLDLYAENLAARLLDHFRDSFHSFP
jgi:hypothetical protein